jgi:hypothetical protein
MLRKVVASTVLITFAMMMITGASCQQSFKDNWDQFIQVACENYETYHPIIEGGAATLQDVLDLIINGWPDSGDTAGSQIKGFILAAQLVIAGLTQVLALVAKTCPEKVDADLTEKVVSNVLKNPVVQMAAKQAKVNIAKKTAKKK